ncbi:MAG: gamma carbonic anhydrase family protein [Pseudomonadota bacterium]
MDARLPAPPTMRRLDDGGAAFGPQVEIDPAALVHDTALIHGRVRLAAGVSVWPNVVIRAEAHRAEIGANTNLQDFVMVHVGYETPTIVGRNCSITHHVTIHGCEIGDDCLIGINATVMDGAVIGPGSIVAGHAIVTEGAVFPAHSIIAGTPARLVKTRDCAAANRTNAEWYARNAAAYARGVHRVEDWDG